MARLKHVLGPARPPAPLPDPLPEPPAIEAPMDVVRSILPAGPANRYDVALFEQLCREYAGRPLVPNPRRYDRDAMAESARGRLNGVHRAIDLSGAKLLEVGCLRRVRGLLVQPPTRWARMPGALTWSNGAPGRTCAATASTCCSPTCRPRIPSSRRRSTGRCLFTAWEHVEHPYRLAHRDAPRAQAGRALRTKANLHRGPQASHLYREIPFPFPHLLFSDEVISDALAKRGKAVPGAAWVNRLTWAQYERYFHEVGFRMLALRFRETPLDEESTAASKTSWAAIRAGS